MDGHVSWIEAVAEVRSDGDKSAEFAIFYLWSLQKADVIYHDEHRDWRSSDRDSSSPLGSSNQFNCN